MKKLYILAALLMATSSAHAGGISLQIEGQRVTIEAPRGCASLSCINITAPGFKGLKSNSSDDDDDAAPAPARLNTTTPGPSASATMMITRRRPESPVSRATSPSAATTMMTTRQRLQGPIALRLRPGLPIRSQHPLLPRRPKLPPRWRRKPRSRNRLPRRLKSRSRHPRPQPAPVAAAPADDPKLAARRLGHRREQGQRSHRAVAATISAATP